jgi:glycosyltransferase involved in cell wall biosynthesis
LKVSIITVTYNSAATLAHTIQSVRDQDHPDIEYIIVDGNSVDGTQAVIKENQDIVHRWISEQDKGLYDAMNKGIKMASGDIVGILHSDDFYNRKDSISQIVTTFQRIDTQSVFADLAYVNPSDLNKIVRNFSSKRFSISRFKFGFMPAHPTFFTYRVNFEKYRYYKLDYNICADFELLLRFLLIHKLSFTYLPINLLTMRTGGASTKSFQNNMVISKEMIKACKENGINTNYFLISFRFIFKIFEIKLFPNTNYLKNNK